MSKLADFESIASENGIPLPDLLRNLLIAGATEYGADWSSTWRERCLNNPPALISCHDFEWIDATASLREIKDWLNPDAQGGKKFLPFAKSGAGDIYCLMPLVGSDGEQFIGVAYIWHDDDRHRIRNRSFTDFVCSSFLESFADLESSFPSQEALQSIKADVEQVTRFMSTEHRNYLRGFLQFPLLERAVQDGPRSQPHKIWSLISGEQLEIELKKFPPPGLPLSIVSRDDLFAEPVPGLNWRDYANNSSNPKNAYAAMESYRKEKGVSWAEAKAAVEQYITDPERNNWQSHAKNPKNKLAAIQIYQKEHQVNFAEAKKVIDQYIENVKNNT